MAFFQPAPVLGRATVKRLAHQLSKLSRPSLAPLPFSNSTTSAASATSSFIHQRCHHTIKPSKSSLSVLHFVPRLQTIQAPTPVAAFARGLNTSSSKKTATAATFDPKFEADPPASSTENTRSNNNSFPETSSKSVAYWLLGSAASVFGIVVFGGLTRLTESGYVLSTTHFPPPPKFEQHSNLSIAA